MICRYCRSVFAVDCAGFCKNCGALLEVVKCVPCESLGRCLNGLGLNDRRCSSYVSPPAARIGRRAFAAMIAAAVPFKRCVAAAPVASLPAAPLPAISKIFAMKDAAGWVHVRLHFPDCSLPVCEGQVLGTIPHKVYTSAVFRPSILTTGDVLFTLQPGFRPTLDAPHE